MLTYRAEWVIGTSYKYSISILICFEITFLGRLCQGIKEGIFWLKEVRANWFAE